MQYKGVSVLPGPRDSNEGVCMSGLPSSLASLHDFLILGQCFLGSRHLLLTSSWNKSAQLHKALLHCLELLCCSLVIPNLTCVCPSLSLGFKLHRARVTRVRRFPEDSECSWTPLVIHTMSSHFSLSSWGVVSNMSSEITRCKRDSD